MLKFEASVGRVVLLEGACFDVEAGLLDAAAGLLILRFWKAFLIPFAAETFGVRCEEGDAGELSEGGACLQLC